MVSQIMFSHGGVNENFIYSNPPREGLETICRLKQIPPNRHAVLGPPECPPPHHPVHCLLQYSPCRLDPRSSASVYVLYPVSPSQNLGLGWRVRKNNMNLISTCITASRKCRTRHISSQVAFENKVSRRVSPIE